MFETQGTAGLRARERREVIGRVEQVYKVLHGNRQSVALALYAAISAASYACAYLLRFEFTVPQVYAALFTWTVIPVVLVRIAAFRLFRLTRERWRYASTRDVVRLAAACAVGSAVLLLVFSVVPGAKVPRSVLAIEYLLTCALTAGVWITYRLSFEHLRRNTGNEQSQRVLIIGAGDAGNMLAREMLRRRDGYLPVGFVDDDPTMWGATIHGLEVVGATADLASIVRQLQPDLLLIAVPSAGPADLRRIVSCCEGTKLPFKVLPGIAAVLAGHVQLEQLRDLRIEDLLGREPVKLDLPELIADLHGATVLITGAAGSIGSELARQVAANAPGRLLLLDQSETELFYVDLELRARYPGLLIVPIIADVVDKAAMRNVFERYRPTRVYHAAAYKHVPMMENNPREAIRNNVLGTWRVAELAGRFGAEKVILVSTDKAVRPTSVMGATKRVAELLMIELQSHFPGTEYGAVRFGNVLGSSGSVIPVFRRQLAAGEPLTVTDPETTRYFMTVPEAVQLILQASLLPELRGHIAMLDMGEPVRIIDLAQNLLRLSGAEGQRGRIIFTGLRPGEKLHEELAAPDEETAPTVIEKIRIIRSTTACRPITPRLPRWEAALEDGDMDALRSDFSLLFPDLQLYSGSDLYTPRPLEAVAGD